MPAFDREDIRLRLEAMKLLQSSLQQIMTLSAGALVLYFSFIGKAPFVTSRSVFGVLAVLLWIAALCAAAIAHWLHAPLFNMLYYLLDAREVVDDLEDSLDPIIREMERAIDPASVLKRAQSELADKLKQVKKKLSEFERTFFPVQKTVNVLVGIALSGLILGFGALAVAYCREIMA
jgi:hypothetical protein